MSGISHGFLLSSGDFDTIDIPGATNTFVKGVNDRGTLCGFYDFGASPSGFCAQIVAEPDRFALVLLGALALCCWIPRMRETARLRIVRHRGRATQLSDITGMITLTLATLFPLTVLAQGSSLTFVYPLDNQIVGGPNLVLYAATRSPSPDQAIIFELSLDGTDFVELPLQEAPDLGVGSYTTSVDTTALPVGSVFFRAQFASDTTGPIISVQVRRTPTPACRVSRLSSLMIMQDCSASQDDNGGITSYVFEFGDNTAPVVSASPTVTHSYSAFGTYPVSVTVIDAMNLSSTLYKQLVLVQLALLQNRPMCGCSQMTVNRRGRSTLPDARRPRNPMNPAAGFNEAPLGLDPMFVTFNFEVSAALTRNSDPTRCVEGQDVRATFTNLLGRGMADYMVCAGGRMPPPRCTNNRDCDTLTTCNGGLVDGQSCATAAGVQRCLLGGGQCNRMMDGMCMAFPFDGANGPRGTDDYRVPYPDDGGPKLHTSDGRAIWLDFPGAAPRFTQANIGQDFRFDGDFLASVTGAGGNCSCHFTIVLDWNNAARRYRDASGIMLVNDSMNCVLGN